ncbi:MAG TPA: ABC transporter permease [Rhodothermales bacterium]|nr:ABC transporter permease [Rhodothermales bacterium]
MLQKIIYNFLIALESINSNKVRSLLTMLGIIFGVASVIAMLAIGKGAQEEVLSQIRLLGANNVIIRPVIEQEEGSVAEEESQASEKKPFSPGLTMADAESIENIVPGVESVSPEVIIETQAVRAGLRRSTKLVGVAQSYFDHGEFNLADGKYFTDEQIELSAPVAIIGQKVKTRFFTQEEPIGKRIKAGNLWLTVVGVLEQRAISQQSIESLGIRDYNYDIYTPISTMLLRFEDRARVTTQDVQASNSPANNNNNANANTQPANYNQLDQLVVRVEQSELVPPVAEVISRMLERRHYGVVDYEVVVPEQLLEQERRTQTIFNIVLAAIASISLIVGGIGIMNIMLASVLERTREIGVRRSLGATRRDVILQFLIEAITISFTGGVIGILLGVGLSIGIEMATGILTVISGISVVLAFLVSVSVGLIFGLLPAKRAAEHDPVVALRYE